MKIIFNQSARNHKISFVAVSINTAIGTLPWRKTIKDVLSPLPLIFCGISIGLRGVRSKSAGQAASILLHSNKRKAPGAGHFAIEIM
ncbi:hypothetical protein [Cypionkella psychrotolerans]|uniref:hypothetical protein n=1 Tax=Cypionkella psychrotolerans TaxID=1678131 RepID=UPI0006B46FEB|nr:hypothetical protein [Cypionkella psychrotolerans]